MYTVQPCVFSTTRGDVAGYVICNDSDSLDMELMYVNRYLHQVAVKSDSTAKQYAYRLKNFLNFLLLYNKSVMECTDKDIVKFMHSKQYDLDASVVNIQQRISPSALAAHYFPIRGLFIYLYNCRLPIKVNIELIKTRSGKNSYLSGIAQTMPVPDIVMDSSYKNGAADRDYIKWYTEEQKEALLSAFRTIRNKCIMSIGLDGARIDEILSSRIEDYDVETGTLTPLRSKGKADGSELRTIHLSERSIKLLNDYLLNEREKAEAELYEEGKMLSRYLFIVLRRGKNFGSPLSYRSYMYCLKTAARRAGFDEKKIRSHSGRSTRVNEIFSDWAEHPARWTEEEIREMFGWKTIESAEQYLNQSDTRRKKAITKKLLEHDKEVFERNRKRKSKRGDGK